MIDHISTIKHAWPFYPEAKTRQKYFNYINVKSERPWFSSYDIPGRNINLITRLRTGHVCVGEFFSRLGWNIAPTCRCGYETSSVLHYVNDCPLFSEGRVKFIKFFYNKFKTRTVNPPEWNFLIYNPTMESVTEIGDLLLRDDIVI